MSCIIFFSINTVSQKDISGCSSVSYPQKSPPPIIAFTGQKSHINEGRKIRNFMNLKPYESEGLGTDNTDRQTDKDLGHS